MLELMKLHSGHYWLVWRNISLRGFSLGAIQKYETFILGILGNSIFASYKEKYVLLWDIAFSLLNFWMNYWKTFVGFQLGVFRKLRSLFQELWGIQCDWVYLFFYVKILKQVFEEAYVGLLWRSWLCVRSKMAHWESLERFDPTISIKHH